MGWDVSAGERPPRRRFRPAGSVCAARGMTRIVTLLLALAVAGSSMVSSESASANWLTRGALGTGVIIAGIDAAEVYAAIATGVAMAGAAGCAANRCGDTLASILAKHPIIGPGLARRELGLYARRHPGSEATVGTVAAAAGVTWSAGKQTDSAGLPVSPSAEGMRPPGDCEPDQWKGMQEEVERSCKPGYSITCLPTDLPAELSRKAAIFSACAMARTRINKICFKGGDKGHRDQETAAYRGLARCQGVLR